MDPSPTGPGSPGSYSPASDGFLHGCLVTDSDDALRRVFVPAVRRSLATGAETVLMLRDSTQRLVRAALGSDGEHARWTAPHASRQRLGFAFERLRRGFAAARARGAALDVFTEPDFDTVAETAARRVAGYLAYEAVCGTAFADCAGQLICVWDSRRYPTLVVENARYLHRYQLGEAGLERNEHVADVHEYLAGSQGVPPPEPPRPCPTDTTIGHSETLGLLRAEVDRCAQDAGFDADATSDVVTAVNEVVTNGLMHGRPPVRVRCWREADVLLVQVDDRGDGTIPPLAGYRPPDDGHGRGLWLARQFTDVVTVHTGPGGATVRLHFPRDIIHGDRDLGSPP